MTDFFKSIPHQFTPKEKELIEKAIAFAAEAHQGQKRKSGEPFATHPVAAATILGQIFP